MIGDNRGVAWTFIRPTDASVLDGRPLVDLGTGDGQTILALTDGGVRVGIDRSRDALRAARRSGLEDVLVAPADVLPLRSESVQTVTAGDLFHHADDAELGRILEEIRRVLIPEGALVAWWYELGGRGGVGEPAFPRSYADVAGLAVGFTTLVPLELEFRLEPSPPTVGMIARR